MKTEDAERILKLFADSAEQGKEFVLQEAPDVVQQLILWKRMEHGVIAVVLLLFAVIGWRLVVVYGRRATEARKKENNSEAIDWEGGQIFVGIVSVALSCVSLGITIHSLQVWLAPKVYVLEYAADLLR